MRKEKQLLLDEIKEKVDSSTAMIITRYDRLEPNASWEFRDKLSKNGAVFEVVRKRIFAKALEQAGIKLEDMPLNGHIGVVFVNQPEAMEPAKVLFKFSEANGDVFEVLSATIEGKVLTGKEVETLSKLPGINEMRANMLSLFTSPMSQMLSTLEAVMSGPLSILEQKS